MFVTREARRGTHELGPQRACGSAMPRSFSHVACAMAIIVGCQSSDDDPPQTTNTVETAPVTPPPSPDTAPAPSPAEPEERPLPARTPPARAVTSEWLDVAGTPRSFVLATPGTYARARRYPLVLVLHGDGQDSSAMRAAFPFDDVSAEDAIVAYPSGAALGWNLYDPAESNQDLAFVIALVASLKARFAIDPARVFATGFSSGAFMLNQIGCRRPSLLRAIAPHSGGAPQEPRDPTATRWDNGFTRCADQTLGGGPAVMVIHGTADTLVTYDSGEFTASYWAYVDGCQPTRSLAGKTPECAVHDGCPAATPVVFCSIPSLEHTLWTGAAEATWRFFGAL